jgi:probable HAF family extracellular repeat protein
MVWSRFVVSAVAALSASATMAQSFHVIPSLGGGTYSPSYGVSDGGHAAGVSTSGFDTRAYLWTGGAPTDLGTLGGSWSEGLGISANGQAVVGTSSVGGGRQRAFRWMQGLGMQDLGAFHPQGSSAATAANADGSVVVGWAHDANADERAFRWTASGLLNLGTLGGSSSMALGVSADGSRIVGQARTAAGSTHPFLWTATSGMVDLGPGLVFGSANAISPDGSVVVGRGVDGGEYAFRWTEGGGIVPLEPLAGGTGAEAYDVSSFGRHIVGSIFVGGEPRAFLWTPDAGMRDLNLLFGAMAPTGFEMWTASGISSDGRYITGFGSRDGFAIEGYVIDTVPEPTGLLALGAGIAALRLRRRRVRL